MMAAVRADKLELLQLLEEKERRKAGRKLFTYYPEAGPLRRALYPKHLEFFGLGASKRERLFLAANRVGKCVAAGTVIDTPHGAPRRVEDIDGPHWVWAWDGEKRVPALAEAPFTKPSEMVYRVFFRSGRYVDCAAEHRFLSEAGWLFLSDLFGCVPCLPGSTEGRAPAASLEDALCLMRTGRDSRADCRQGFRSDGGQPHAAPAVGRASSPSRADAQTHSPALSRWGALVDTGRRSLLRLGDRLSSLCDGLLSAVQFAGSSAQGLCTAEGPCLDSPPKSPRPAIAEALRPQPTAAAEPHPDSRAPAFVTPNGLSDSVVCYQPVGVQPIYDFHVPGFRNYCAAGVIHHNTEGAGGYELACHLTGIYPAWWNGRRFNHSIQCWAAGDTRETVRDILQLKLLGKRGSEGTGLIPRDSIVRTSPGFIPDAVQAIWVKHASGGISVVQFKSYDQGREAFQGTEQDAIWLDEEPPQDVYTECLLRTMTNNGLVMLTFTPLRGMSEVVLAFMPGGAVPESQEGPKSVTTATWDDVPHLGEKEKADLLASIPPFQREARSKGLPQMGAGLIYPVPESVFVVPPFDIPKHWPRSYGLDVGWNMTAAVFGAIDRETDTAYVYSVHRRGEVEPAVHAAAISARGPLKGAIDPASAGSSQVDGKKVMEEYQKLGLDLEPAANAVDAGILATWERLATGRLKVLSSCTDLLSEMRLYRRNEKGKVVKENDHACDAMRYWVMTGIDIARAPSPLKPKPDPLASYGNTASWMG